MARSRRPTFVVQLYNITQSWPQRFLECVCNMIWRLLPIVRFVAAVCMLVFELWALRSIGLFAVWMWQMLQCYCPPFPFRVVWMNLFRAVLNFYEEDAVLKVGIFGGGGDN
eukprot:Trichotokara_eunicae@DN3842_c0_g1_i1.p1